MIHGLVRAAQAISGDAGQIDSARKNQKALRLYIFRNRPSFSFLFLVLFSFLSLMSYVSLELKPIWRWFWFSLVGPFLFFLGGGYADFPSEICPCFSAFCLTLPTKAIAVQIFRLIEPILEWEFATGILSQSLVKRLHDQAITHQK